MMRMALDMAMRMRTRTAWRTRLLCYPSSPLLILVRMLIKALNVTC